MTRGLRRFHHSAQTHFITFSCYRRECRFRSASVYDLFLGCLEDMRRRFSMCVYGYVVMPEHVHLLVNEPPGATLADAVHFLKLSFAKRVAGGPHLRSEVSPSKRALIFNLRVPHVCPLLANVGPRSKNKSFFYRFGTCDSGRAPLLTNPARNGAPPGFEIRAASKRASDVAHPPWTNERNRGTRPRCAVVPTPGGLWEPPTS
jgi:REP element-mobilizing transposase RayT